MGQSAGASGAGGGGASASLAVINAGAGIYTSMQETQTNKYNLKAQSASIKADLLKDYRRQMATSLAQGAASGFTGEGNLGQINDANTLTLNSDLNELEYQTQRQIKLNKIAGQAAIANSITGAANEAATYSLNRGQYQDIGGATGTNASIVDG